MSPHPSNYQNTPTGSFYQRSSTGSVPTLDPNAPLERRKKQAPEGPQAGVDDTKGKKKALADAQSPSSTHETGKDPLEIAYGPTIGTHTEITKDDFDFDTENGQHMPQRDGSGPSRPSQPSQGDGGSEGERPSERAGQDEHSKRADDNKSPQYRLEGEDEFRNVWGR